MKGKNLVSSKGHEPFDRDTIEMLSRYVFSCLSNLVIFNLAHFCVGRSTDGDGQFQGILDQEIFRRGLVTTPDVYTRAVNLNRFNDADMESVDMWFGGDGDPDGQTQEDIYIELLTGRDRWAERNTPKQKRRSAQKAT